MAARRRGTVIAAAGLGAAALGLAACGGGSGGSGGGSAGGTLKVVGSSDVDHLDTSSVYTTWGNLLARQFARTLFNVKAADNFDDAIKVVADGAAEIPTMENGGISKDGKTYTIKLRDGMQWDTNPVRPVVAGDFVRGIKRICNPAKPSGGLGYYTDTIEGFAKFCDGFTKVGGNDAAAIAAYQNQHQVTGLQAKDDKTLVVKLNRPASDFTNILGLAFSAAAPVEYDRYVPDSPDFRTHTISDGPYKITSYQANKSITLAKNPAWKAASDPVRQQNPTGSRSRWGRTRRRPSSSRWSRARPTCPGTRPSRPGRSRA